MLVALIKKKIIMILINKIQVVYLFFLIKPKWYYYLCIIRRNKI